MSNTAGLRFHPLPLGGDRGRHAETFSQASGRPRRSPSVERRALQGALVSCPWGRSGSHGASVLADAGPREHWAPVFSSVQREPAARSSLRLLCSPRPEEEEVVGAGEENGAGRR